MIKYPHASPAKPAWPVLGLPGAGERFETYYTGATNNLEHRLTLHNAGKGAKYLRGREPVRLVYAKEYRYSKNALRAERYLKHQTRRDKEELVKVYEAQQRS